MSIWNIIESVNFLDHRKNQLASLFLSGVARRVGVTILWIFSPIYIYQAGISYGFSSRNAIVGVLLYYVITVISRLFCLLFSENLSQKTGFKGIIRLSLAPFLLFLGSLIYASQRPEFFILAAIFWGMHSGFFWWGYHGYFIKKGDDKHFGLRIGEARFLETLAAVTSPLIGAFIVNYWGFKSVFVFSALFMILALFLLGKNHDKRQRRDIQFSEVTSLLKSHKSMTLAYVGYAAEAMLYTVIWPIFLFIFFGQVISLGIVVSLSVLLAAIYHLFLGRWSDKQGERKIVATGTPLVTASWFIRIVNKTLPSFILADSIRNFSQGMVALPLDALTYKKGIEGGTARAILFRATAFVIGNLLGLGMAIAWLLFGGNIGGVFLVAAVLSLLPLVAVYKKRLQNK